MVVNVQGLQNTFIEIVANAELNEDFAQCYDVPWASTNINDLIKKWATQNNL